MKNQIMSDSAAAIGVLLLIVMVALMSSCQTQYKTYSQIHYKSIHHKPAKGGRLNCGL